MCPKPAKVVGRVYWGWKHTTQREFVRPVIERRGVRELKRRLKRGKEESREGEEWRIEDTPRTEGEGETSDVKSICDIVDNWEERIEKREGERVVE